MSETSDGMEPAPNPHRVGACPECGSWRADGRPPYLHKSWCTRGSDAQIDRWMQELQARDHGGPPLRCTDPGHDHERTVPHA